MSTGNCLVSVAFVVLSVLPRNASAQDLDGAVDAEDDQSSKTSSEATSSEATTAEAATAPEDARGWLREPRSGPYVFPAIGRAIGSGFSALVWLVVAPIRAGVYLEAKYDVSEKVKDVFYNDARTAGVIPVASFVSGFGLAVGAKAFHDDLLGDDEAISVSAKYGGAEGQTYQFKFELPRAFEDRVYLRARLRYESKGNLFFGGIGNADADMGTMLDPRESSLETRYRERRYLGVLSTGALVGPETSRLRVGLSALYNDRSFLELPLASAETSIGEVYDTDALVGFGGFSLAEVTADLEFDLLEGSKNPTRALRLRAFGGGAPTQGDFRFLHFGGELGLEQTLVYPGRVLHLRLAHEVLAGKADEIPFTDLPRLGGTGLLRGYLRDQFRDKLATVGTVEYHYPIHANFGAALFLELGKVARTYGELAESGSWHLGSGGGLFLRTSSGIKARFDVAYGDGIQLYFSTDVLEAFSRRRKEL